MKVKANIPKLNQRYYNPFKEKGIYPFNKIGRVLIDKDTAEILMYLGENDSTLSKIGAPWIYDETRHDIAVYFPKFYSKRNWNQEELSDSFITEIPVNHVEQIPEYIKRKGFEIFPEFVREDGSVRPYILIGATKGVSLNNQLRSIIGYKPTVNKTLQEFLNESRFGRNNNWNIETIGIISMVQFLYKIAFQNLDSQKTIGLGYSNRTNLGLTGSTVKLGNHTGSLDPFQNSIDKPNEKIKYSMSAENGKLKIYSNGQEIKIKTYQNKTLEECLVEETEDYCLYSDGQVITIEQYVPGVYDKYLEVKELIKKNEGFLELHKIVWEHKDDAKLLISINDAELSKPVVIPEDVEPVVYELRKIPMPVYFCCRVDKKTGEIYSGRGYENFADKKPLNQAGLTSTIKYLSDGWARVTYTESGNTPSNRIYLSKSKLPISDDIGVYFSANFRNVNGVFGVFGGDFNGKRLSFTKDGVVHGVLTNVQSPGRGFNTFVFSRSPHENFEIELDKLIITKTAAQMPFVKSVMPDGMIELVIDTTEDTHTFIYNGHSERIPSLHVKGGKNGLDFYNLGSDPMPIKIAGGKTLEQCKVEETEDYVLYSDGTVVTIDQYAPGTYDEFLDVQRLIQRDSEMLLDAKIEWTHDDDIELLKSLNEKALTKPVVLFPEDEPVVYEARNIPVPIDFCCRVDKKSGEIYIGEGYENLSIIKTVPTPNFINLELDLKNKTVTFDLLNSYVYGVIAGALKDLKKNDSYTFYCLNVLDGAKSIECEYFGSTEQPKRTEQNKITFTAISDGEGVNIGATTKGLTVGSQKLKFQLTKTSTPKPFVKSVMPSSKLSFVTSATSETHSFVVTGAGSARDKSNGDTWYFDCGGTETFFNYDNTTETVNVKRSLLISKDFLELIGVSKVFRKDVGMAKVGNIAFSRTHKYCDSFFQLLIYNGNLTEAELKFENDRWNPKSINYNLKSNNQHLIKYSKFKSLNIYSKLTNEEFEVESNKQITYEDNRNTSNEYNQDNQISIFGIEDFYGNCNSMINGIQSKDDGYYINNKKTNLISITNTLNNTFKYGYIKKIADLGYLNIAKEVNYINDQPDERLSLFFGIENCELVYHDSPNDPFPLKTINGNGIQKWEDTEDYTIYIDKDAVFTRIEQYVSGSYQTFIERKNDIDSSSELLKIHDITWTSEDDSKLMQDINNEALARLESQQMMLSVEKEIIQPIILEPKIVPTTYDCCFTIRKDTNEFYINEGYENLAQRNNCDNHSHNTVSNVDSNGVVTVSTMDSQTIQMNGRYGYKTPLLIPSTEYTASIKIIESLKPSDCVLSTLVNSFLNPYDIKLKLNIRADATGTSQSSPKGSINQYLATVGDNEIKMLYQITKTSTPKPFVKTIQPNCKLAFVTNATSETHSFVMKGIEQNVSDFFAIYSCDNSFTDQLYSRDRTTKPYNVYRSKSFKPQLTGDDPTYLGVTKGLLLIGAFRGLTTSTINSFKQLLIYKGNLTEAELKAELSKDIKLKHFEYKEENSNLYYTDLFKSHSLGQIGICILNSNYTSLNFGGIFATDFSEIETFKNNLTGARVCYYP